MNSLSNFICGRNSGGATRPSNNSSQSQTDTRKHRDSGSFTNRMRTSDDRFVLFYLSFELLTTMFMFISLANILNLRVALMEIYETHLMIGDDHEVTKMSKIIKMIRITLVRTQHREMLEIYRINVVNDQWNNGLNLMINGIRMTIELVRK